MPLESSRIWRDNNYYYNRFQRVFTAMLEINYCECSRIWRRTYNIIYIVLYILENRTDFIDTNTNTRGFSSMSSEVTMCVCSRDFFFYRSFLYIYNYYVVFTSIMSTRYFIKTCSISRIHVYNMYIFSLCVKVKTNLTTAEWLLFSNVRVRWRIIILHIFYYYYY